MPRRLDSAALKRSLAVALALPCLLPAVPSGAAADGAWTSGEHVYAKVCRHCHESSVAPVLKGRQLPPPYIAAVVRNGLRAMPAFPASHIDNLALQQVAEYLAKAPAPAARP